MAYIDKELFKQDIKMRYCNNCARPNEIKCRACHIDDMLGEIEDAPTADVVEVVRCPNCTYCENMKCTNLKDSTGNPLDVAIFDYCSQGLRKDAKKSFSVDNSFGGLVDD